MRTPESFSRRTPQMEVLELLRDLHPDTWEDKYRAYEAQVEEYESCGYW